ncbi:MAG TPA: DPP IV N-terminal domain-containing protein, partial [Gemmataceae bacterium]|nr:DPP IV N-terminal domain-containing protein [Gemmataceae bacterium]
MRKHSLLLFAAALLLPCLAWCAACTDAAQSSKPSGPATFVGWLDDDTWLSARDGSLFKVEALSGKEAAFAGSDGLNETLAARAADIVTAQKTGGEVVDMFETLSGGPNPFQQVNKGAIAKEVSVASPDGKWNAVNRKNDIYFVEKADNKQTRVTKDGSDVIFNGRADAVYQEEIFYPGRSLTAMWWSPDSKHLAFFQLDDTNVPKFTIINHTQILQTPEVTTYPKAGQPNPILKVGIAHVADGSVTWADLSKYDPKD